MIEWTISLGEFLAVTFACLGMGVLIHNEFKQPSDVELDPIDEAILNSISSPDVRHIEKVRANAMAIFPYETRQEQVKILSNYMDELDELRRRNPAALSQHARLHPNYLDLDVRDSFDAHVHAALTL